MIGLLIALAATIYFFLEAKRRAQPPFKWGIIAFVSFVIPELVFAWVVAPVAYLLIEAPVADFYGIQRVTAFIGVAVGVFLLFWARKRLYLNPRSVNQE